MKRLVFILILLHALVLRADEVFKKDVLPMLQKHCVKCHGPEKQKGKLRLDILSTDFLKDRAAAETWHDASDQVKLGKMPPEKSLPNGSTAT